LIFKPSKRCRVRKILFCGKTVFKALLILELAKMEIHGGNGEVVYNIDDGLLQYRYISSGGLKGTVQ